AYNAAQQEASENRARYEAAESQLRTADPAEKAKLSQQLEALRRDYTDSLEKATTYQLQLNEIQKSRDLATSEHSTLLNRIHDLQTRTQDLQTQLNAAIAERDKLRSDQALAAKDNSALLKRNEDLRARVNTLSADVYKLHIAVAQQTMARPTFKVVPQFSVVRLTEEPFGGTVAIGVGDVLVGNLSN